jgi:hypothetical protein
MMKRFMIAAGLALLSTSPALAQPAKPVEVKEAEPAAPASMRNISLELTITDQTTAADSAKKVVSMIVGDRQRGSIRTSGSVITPVEGRTSVILNVDARPWIQVNNNVILMTLTIEYSPKLDPANETKDMPRTQLNQSMSLLLESGKPTVISQAADPLSNRKVMVEVKATIMK